MHAYEPVFSEGNHIVLVWKRLVFVCSSGTNWLYYFSNLLCASPRPLLKFQHVYLTVSAATFKHSNLVSRNSVSTTILYVLFGTPTTWGAPSACIYLCATNVKHFVSPNVLPLQSFMCFAQIANPVATYGSDVSSFDAQLSWTKISKSVSGVIFPTQLV